MSGERVGKRGIWRRVVGGKRVTKCLEGYLKTLGSERTVFALERYGYI